MTLEEAEKVRQIIDECHGADSWIGGYVIDKANDLFKEWEFYIEYGERFDDRLKVRPCLPTKVKPSYKFN